MTTDNVLIKVDNLCKSFGDTEVLKGINAEIDKGRRWAWCSSSSTCFLT